MPGRGRADTLMSITGRRFCKLMLFLTTIYTHSAKLLDVVWALISM
jgi:hypothetical protein